MCQRRIAPEREMSKDVLEWQDIMNLLKDGGLIKIVSYIGPYYEKLINELIVNLSNEYNIEGIKEVRKVHVRGCVKFSPKIINVYLGRRKSVESTEVSFVDKIPTEITTGKVKQLPKKSLLPSGFLMSSMQY